jgi:hypothetical protein
MLCHPACCASSRILAGDWRRLDERIEGLSSEIEALARQDKGCERLMTVPGIGPIISSAMVAAIGTWRCVHERPRLRRLAGARYLSRSRPATAPSSADIETRQSLPARLFVQAGLGRVVKVGKAVGSVMGSSHGSRRPRKATASQRPRHRARQQARPHCLERPGSWRTFEASKMPGRVIFNAKPSNALPAEVCERMRTRWRIGLPGACEHW